MHISTVGVGPKPTDSLTPCGLDAQPWVQSQLYEIKPGDPLSMGLATLLPAAVSAIAGYIPARRAAAADPLSILRYE